MIFEILEHGFGLVLTEEDVPAIERIAKTAAPRPFSEVQSQSAALDTPTTSSAAKCRPGISMRKKAGKALSPQAGTRPWPQKTRIW